MDWTFLTNHGHVLLVIAQDPETRIKDIAAKVGITERAAQRIVADLMQAGYVTANRVGRRNAYQVHPELPFRHPLEQHNQVGKLLALIQSPRRHKVSAA